MAKIFKSGANEAQRKIIRDRLNEVVQELKYTTGLPGESIVQEARYWQGSGTKYKTDPTTTDKNKSWSYYKGICQICYNNIDENNDAVYHHEKRGVENLHGPENMKPVHNSCHDNHHHDNPKASLTKGSQTKKS